MIGRRNFEPAVKSCLQAIVWWTALISITGYSLLVGSKKNKKLFRKELNKLETKSKQIIRSLNGKSMKIKKSGRRKARLINQKGIKEKLMKNV